MLKKVLKYDLQSMGKSLFPLYAALIIMAIILRLLNLVADKLVLIEIIYGFMLLLFVLLMVGALFYTFFIAIKRYYKNLFSNEGYLTHTLPVSASSLLVSKTISAFVYLIATSIVMILALMIAIDTSQIFEILKQGIEIMALSMKVSNSTIIIFSILFIILGYMSYVLMVYAGISLGQIHNNNKLVFSVVWSIVLYYISQIISIVMLGVMVVLINPELIDMINQNSPAPDEMNQIIIFSFITSLILIGIYYIISHNRLKHLNLQ